MSNPITLDNLATAIVNNKNLATQNDVSTLLPSQTSNSNKFLTTDGTYLNWGEVDVLPNQASNAGKFLTTDGISTTWGDAGGASGVNVHGFLSGVSNTDEAASLDLTFTRHNTTDLTISIPKVSFPSSYIAQTGAFGATQNEGEGLFSIGNTNAQAAADRSGGAKTKNSIFIGPEAGDGIEAINDNYGGDNATAVGFRALGGLESGQHMSNTTAIGSHAGYLTRSIHSVMIGVNAGKNCRSQGSVYIGNSAGQDCTFTTGFNVGIGYEACKGANQRDNVCIGYRAGSGGHGRYGQKNTYVGHDAAQAIDDTTHTGRNTCIGQSAGKSSVGYRNIYIGVGAGKDDTANEKLKIGTLLEGTLPSYAGGSATGIFKINAGHVEVEVPNLPGSYDSGHPNRIWSDSGTLMVGDSSGGGGGDPIPYSQNGNQTSLYVGPLANDSSTNPYNNYTTALGYKAHANVSSGGQWNANFGAQSGHYYNGQFNVFVGYASGGGGSSSSGGSKAGDYNLMIGNEAGNKAAGHRNIFVGPGAGKNQGTDDDRFKLGYYSYLLFDGKMPTGSTEGELLINATKLKVNSSIKTQADLSSLEVGQLYVDTSAGNVLKVKMS